MDPGLASDGSLGYRIATVRGANYVNFEVRFDCHQCWEHQFACGLGAWHSPEPTSGAEPHHPRWWGSGRLFHPDPGTVSNIRDFQVPTTVKQVRTLLGMASYYRCSVKDFNKQALPQLNPANKTLHRAWAKRRSQPSKI